MKNISHEKLTKTFRYDSNTGLFYWLKPTSNSVKIGDKAGIKKPSGYIVMTINNTSYYAHRMAWFYVNGFIPNNPIDHINRNKSDNRITNLRVVTNQCNMRNSNKQKNNKSGVTGVSWNKDYNKWQSNIKVDSIGKYLGMSIFFEEAVALRLAAEQCLDWSGCNSRTDAFLFMKKYLNKRS